MNAVVDERISEAVQTPGQLGELRELPLVSLRESPWNPRHYFSEPALDELVESIRGKGITTPLIVRPAKDGFEIGAGARRYRAAQRAGLQLAPCIVRVLDDEQFLELISFENLQREDPHPLDEAAGFRNYIEHTKCSVTELAKKIGQSRSQVYGRLQLAKDLIPEVAQACWDKKITASHAILIARLQPKEQEKALKYCTANDYRKPSERDLREWIESSICLEMAKAPWDLADSSLVPDELKGNRTILGPGSCSECPKRSSNNPDKFPDMQPDQVRARLLEETHGDGKLQEEYIQREIASADVCTDPGCFHRKLKAHLARLEAKAAQSGQELVKITQQWGSNKEAIGRQQWEEVKKSDKDAKPALIVDGENAGKTVYVKVKPAPKAQKPYDFEAENRKRDEKIRREKAIRRKILEAVLEKVAHIDKDDIAQLIQEQLENSRGEGAGILAEVLGVTKCTPAGIVGQLPKWHGKDLGKAIIGAAVAAELGGRFECKALTAAAKRYKVDAAKIRSEMEAQFRQQDNPKESKEAPKASAPAKPKPAAKKAIPPKKTKTSQKLTAAARRRWAEYRRQRAKKQESVSK